MLPLDNIIRAAVSDPRRIVMAEGEDPRIVEGALRATAEGMANISLIGARQEVLARIEALGGDASRLTIVDPADFAGIDELATAFHELRRHKGVDAEAARDAMRQPLMLAAMMVRQDMAEGTIGGAVATTADTVRAALQVIGRAPDCKLVSSFFLMMLCETHHTKKGALVFADCGLVVEPDAAELAEIAHASAQSFEALVKSKARVAMLSFSTQGSARHARVTKVTEATAMARKRDPGLIIEGDLQFDAAFVPAVSAAKAPGSTLEGNANVLVFPNLEAANIGYKIAQRIGGAKAIGPILQGLAKPANDLSRGCSVEDVYHMIAVTVVQAQASQPILAED